MTGEREKRVKLTRDKASGTEVFRTAQMSVSLGLCGSHLPLAFHCVFVPGDGGANKIRGTWHAFLFLAGGRDIQHKR